jgi:putative Mg2+ transporter-C (MgtC) family protein
MDINPNLPAFNAGATLSSLISLSVAFVLGTVIGLERQLRQRTAGLRTNTLVAVVRRVRLWRCASMTCTADHPHRCMWLRYVISGVGFLGADAIHEGRRAGVRPEHRRHPVGIGGELSCRYRLLPEAVLAALFVLAANTLLRPVVNRIQRQPLPEAFSEATYAINVVCQREQQAEVLDQLLLLLEQAQVPVRAVDQRPFGERDVEIRRCCMPPRWMPANWTPCWRRWRDHARCAAGIWNASLEE